MMGRHAAFSQDIELHGRQKAAVNPKGRKQATVCATRGSLCAQLRFPPQIDCSATEIFTPWAAMIKPDQQAKYRTRARELRELAATMKNEHHRKLLLEAAEGYEKTCETGADPNFRGSLS